MTADLDELGLAVDDVVRFKRKPGAARWDTGNVRTRSKDGSVEVVDNRGRMRSIAADRLEVKRKGPRGGIVWVAVTTGDV